MGAAGLAVYAAAAGITTDELLRRLDPVPTAADVARVVVSLAEGSLPAGHYLVDGAGARAVSP